MPKSKAFLLAGNRMHYRDVLKHGAQVVCMPILTDGAPVEGKTETTCWFVYAVLTYTNTIKNPFYKLWWVNHQRNESCPYTDVFGAEIDPRGEHHHKWREERVRT
jgi:hypothetical protein